MKLSDLMQKVNIVKGFSTELGDMEISSLCCDSRKAVPNSVFVCIKGAVSDGHDYAASAYERGCRIFVAEDEISLPHDASVIFAENTREALAEMSQKFFGDPSKEIKVIGITGTKGKTTTAHLIYHILNTNGIKAGYIGTNGVMFDGRFFETVNTTPESYDLAQYMRKMIDADVKYLVLEVSSQAVYLDRIKGMEFETCVFTNLSPDHIGKNEHPSFEHYRDSKARLFSEYSPKIAVYNADEDASEYMMKDCPSAKFSYSLVGNGHFSADDIKYYRDGGSLGVRFTVKAGSELTEKVDLPIPGDFNVSNALAATAVAISAGVSLKDIAKALSTVSLKGRFEVVDALPYATFIIDYAHNGISLRSVLETLRAYEPHRLVCVFGSVGGRTQMRRAELGRVAGELCDFCIITSDNPDNEPPEQIMDDIAAAFPKDGCPFVKIASRREAVLYAVRNAEKGDIVLFAGKGHEDYQLVCGKREYFCERETIIEGAFGMLLGR
ncbi:MAG: UDP-N-acetylmuramoyl-L-alanyl-D-glutamate--2,6-diaminopimelate ligase [Ruminococcaceae bacterium]|nr:UDP-N-acetylmuramoyl-L-alanyl-D-glutamate--2,6-diaminopimelate ligase [Oscillospiraceae bacterium]